jgi:hypothetical protein
MLTYNECIAMFAGLRQAAKQRRHPTDDEAAQAIEDAHAMLASVVSSLSDIAHYCNNKGMKDVL